MNKLLYIKTLSHGHVYECVGMPVNETDDKLEIAFNIVNDKVIDSIQFNTKDIIDQIEIKEVY